MRKVPIVCDQRDRTDIQSRGQLNRVIHLSLTGMTMIYNKHVTSILVGRCIGQLALVALVATGCGGGSGGDAPITPTPGISLLAGSIGGSGNIDGVGVAARFRNPLSIAVDPAGNVYVAQGDVIRKISPAGVVTTVLHATDELNPPNAPGRPPNVAVDASGNLYVTDGNATVRKITPSGIATTLAGAPNQRGTVDGLGVAARFTALTGIAVDTSGQVYVTDGEASTVRKISANGAVTTLAGTPGMRGTTNGVGAAASFTAPNGLTVDGDGNVYVVDGSYKVSDLFNTLLYSNTVRKITPSGVVTTLAGTAGTPGDADGVGTAASFGNPSSISADREGSLYVTDEGNHTIRKITRTGAVTTIAGITATVGISDGVGASARFNHPAGIAIDSTGNLYVADSGNHTIRKLTPGFVVSTLAGQAAVNGSADGVGAAASFGNQAAPYENDGANVNPKGVAVDRAGNVYIADGGNHIIRKVTPTGLVSTLAGTAGARGSADGLGTSARFSYPRGIAVDDTGQVYVADSTNGSIRKITPNGQVTTLAANRGSTPDTRIRYPEGVVVDRAGNVFVSDGYDNLVRKITPAGVMSVFAGSSAAQSIDGTGRQASLNYPRGMTIDDADNLYVAEYNGHTIRKITPAGVVTTVAGTAGVRASDNATGATAGLDSPRGVTIDRQGNLFVVENLQPRIRRITPLGVSSVVAGETKSYGIALGGLPGSLADVGGVAIGAQGVLHATSGAAVLKIQLAQ